MKRTDAILEFLKQNGSPLAHLYNAGMEVQVNVAPCGGERIEGTFNNVNWVGYTDGFETWKSFRIPYGSMDEPVYEERELTYPTKYFDAIGMTGWDWRSKCSRWVAFDFDAIVGHSSKHQKKLDTRDLLTLRAKVESVPWVTLRKSTSGRGLHLYVFIDPTVPTANHREHAALARAILGRLSLETGIDLAAKVDVCGGNMWVWARKQTQDGFGILKQGVPLNEVPVNWREHLTVVTGTRTRVRHKGLDSEDVQQKFDALANQKTNTTLDDDHKKLIRWLGDNGRFFWWDQDTHMLVTHTKHLKDAHEGMSLKGIFDTNTEGTNVNEQNCFAYPIRNGGWIVRRYTQGVEEHSSWSQDGKGWTRCYFNIEPDIATTMSVYGGLEDDKGNYILNDVAALENVLNRLSVPFKSDPRMGDRRNIRVNATRTKGKLIVEIPRNPNDPQFDGWLEKGKFWMKVLVYQPNTMHQETEVELGQYDDVVRHVVNEAGESAGWVVNCNGNWINEPLSHIKPVLDSLGVSNKDLQGVIGTSVLRPWKLVVRPFEPEYLGGRLWNKSSPQLRYKPKMEGTLNLPTWKKVLQHIGSGIDAYVAKDEWCVENNIRTGEEYIMCWCASLFQNPFEPLPYLFIYGEKQNTGKSLFHESLYTLFSPGYVKGVDALTNMNGFNGELEGGVLCFIEEYDLNNNKIAYNRIKEWVTSPTLFIHHKRCTPYVTANTMHWVHCCNSRTYCPVFPGDTRITMIHVENPPENPIAKRDILRMLDAEAPDFLGACLQLKIPDSKERLMLPALNTPDKEAASLSNIDQLETFIHEFVYNIPGHMVTLAEFFDRFQEYLDPSDRPHWTKSKVSKHMPGTFVKGRNPSDASHVWGNMSFVKNATPGRPFVNIEGYLRHE